MREGKPTQRPSQVTMAGWVAVVGSFLVVVGLFDAMSQLHSVEMRDSITEFLAQPPADGLGIEISEAVGLLRALMLFAGAASAAALVFAVFALQRNNGARIGFTVAAALLVATAPVSGFLSLLVAFAAVMLWTRPARDWFAGRAPASAADRGGQSRAHLSQEHPPQDRPENEPHDRPQDRPQDRPVDRPADDPAEPRPTQGFGAPQPESYPGPGPQPEGGRPEHEQPQPPAYGQHGQPPAYGQYGQHGQPPGYAYPYYGYPQQQGGRDPGRRPTTVTVAAWITWVFSVLTAALFALVVVVLLVAPRDLYDTLRNEPQLAQAGLTVDDLVGVLWVTSAVFLFWCLAAFVLAVLAFRRVNWARITLVVSAGATAVFSLVSIVGFPGSIVTLLAAGAVIALLFTGGANEWYSRRSGPSGGYPPYPPQGYGQQPAQQRREDPPKNVW